MTYDVHSYELACRFLEDEKALDNDKNRDELAKEIQCAIEDWFRSKQEGD